MNTANQQTEAAPARAVLACPACGSAASEQVGAQVPAYRTVMGGMAFHLPSYSIKVCPTCALYFKSDTLAHEDLTDYYSRFEADSFDYDQNFPPDRIVRRVLESLPEGAKVLDFGCSSGRIHKGLAIKTETYGVEINLRAADIARKRGIRIIAEEDVRNARIGPFDAIIAADVYEHLTRPSETMEMLTAALATGGRLIVVTGNADAIATRDWMGEFWYFRPEGHFHMMSERHVQWLAKRLSMQVEQLHVCCHYDLPMTTRLRQHVQSFAYGRFKRAPHSALTSLLRLVPLLNRAERWPLAPALTCTADHFVAVYRKN